MNKPEKIQLLVRAFKRMGETPNEGETDLEFFNRIVDERMDQMRSEFLRNQIDIQLSIESSPSDIKTDDL